MRNVLITLLCLLPLMSFTEDKALLNSSTIPEVLRKKADAIYRLENIECEILSESKTKIKYSYVITVLNTRAIDEAEIALPYSSFVNVSKPKGAIYKSNGSKFRSIKLDEIIDVSSISGYSLYEDSRVIYYEPPIKTTPFTISYSYEEEYEGSLFLPSWHVFKGYNIAVEQSNFKVTVSKGLDFKYDAYGLTNEVKITENEESTTYLWQASNIAAPSSEPSSSAIFKEYPTVYTALDHFEFYKTKGSLKNWEQFGNWIYELNKGKDILPEETVQEIKTLTASAKTVPEKVDIVYAYMSNKCRYLNISVGIGGWQPIEADRINEVGYGDCKALSNYGKSLLKAIGIKSNYVIIGAGSHIPNFRPNFVSSQFNHAILCVPLKEDTIWLECTSQKIPAGYLSTFTDNRYALLIDSANSKLVKTPKLKDFLNAERRNATVKISDDFTAEFDVKAKYSGEYESEVYWWRFDNEEDMRRKTKESLSFSDVDLSSYEYTIRKDINMIEEKLKFNVPNIATKMGSRLIMDLNLLNKETYIPKRVSNRKFDIELQRADIESDTITYILPQGYALESNIKPIHFTSEFGSYDATIQCTDNILTYIRNVRYNEGVFDKSLYTNFINFFQEIKSADEQKVLLVKR